MALSAAETSRYSAIIAVCFPMFPLRTLEFIGGSSCRVFLANGDTYFRFAHSNKAVCTLRKERQFFLHVRGRVPLAMPDYSMFSEGCAGFPHPVAGYRAVPGVPIAGARLSAHAARQLGEFLRALHAIAPPSDWPVPASAVPAHAAEDLLRRVTAARRVLTLKQWDWASKLFAAFLASGASNAPHPMCLVHNDVDHFNVLYDPRTGLLTGVIDSEEATVGDPVADFTPLLGEFGQQSFDAALEAYGGPPDPHFGARAVFWSQALPFNELLYGLDTGARVHIENGMQRLERAVRGEAIIGGWPLVKTAADTEWNGAEG